MKLCVLVLGDEMSVIVEVRLTWHFHLDLHASWKEEGIHLLVRNRQSHLGIDFALPSYIQ